MEYRAREEVAGKVLLYVEEVFRTDKKSRRSYSNYYYTHLRESGDQGGMMIGRS